MRDAPSASATARLIARADAARDAIRAGADPELVLSYVIAPTKAMLAAEEARAPAPRTCPSCGEEFAPMRDDAVYHESACRQRAYRRRRRQELDTRTEAFAA